MKNVDKDDWIFAAFAIVLAFILISQALVSCQPRDEIIESDETYSEWIKENM